MAQIVWIEDDYKRLNSLVKLLEKQGHTILAYGSWEEAEDEINYILEAEAIILDIILPTEDDDNPYVGVHILEELRQKYNYHKPIIGCSNVRNPDVRHRLRDLGITEILQKPVRPSKLADVVNQALADAALG